MSMESFLEYGASVPGIGVDELVGRSKEGRLAEAREMLTILGVERYGFLVKPMAAALERYGETASRWITRGTRHRQDDTQYRARLEQLDRAIVLAARSTR